MVRILYYGDDRIEYVCSHGESKLKKTKRIFFIERFENLRSNQYYRSPQAYNDVLTYANTTFTALFTVESILKIIAFGLRVRTAKSIRRKDF